VIKLKQIIQISYWPALLASLLFFLATTAFISNPQTGSPTDLISIITTQGPMAGIVFLLLFRLESKFEKVADALKSVADNQTKLLVLYESMMTARRQTIEDERKQRQRRK